MHTRLEPKTPRRAHLSRTGTRGAVLNATSLWLWLLAALWAVSSGELSAQDAGTAPIITAQPAELPHRTGEGIVRVAATGDGLSYQWYRGEPGDTSAPVTGGTGALLILPPMDAGGRLWVRVTNAAGAVESDGVDVAVSMERPLALWGTGGNFYGQTGGVQQSMGVPQLIRSGVLKIATADDATLYLREDRSLWGMGSGFGSMGWSSIGRIATDVVDVAVGLKHLLFLKSDGSLWTLGGNEYGQRGASGLVEDAPALLTTGVARIAAAGQHSFFVRCDGSLWGMGGNSFGLLGVGDTLDRGVPTLVANGVVEIATASFHSGFVDATGWAWSMGANSDGRLGNGSSSDRHRPVRALHDVSRLALGYLHSLWLTRNGDVWGAGDNSLGQLGLGDQASRFYPVKLASAARCVAVGYGTSFFAGMDGGLWAAGYNSSGQLGNGSAISTTVFIRMAEGVREVAAGTSHMMFLRLPPPRFTAQPERFGVVAGQTALLEVATSSDGPVSYQWYAGAAGDTSKIVVGANSASYVTPPLLADASFWVRATNTYGFTDGATITVEACSSPVITFLPQEVAAVAGQTFSCVVRASGGALRYQWYRGGTGDTSRPVAGGTSAVLEEGAPAADLSYWVRVTNPAGAVDSPAVQVRHLRSARLLTMGGDEWGQLGLRRSMAPTQVAQDVIKIAAAGSVSLWLKSDHTLWAAGESVSGGGPRLVASDVVDFAAGRRSFHVLFIKTDGSLWGFGSNTSRQMGLWGISWVTAPVQIATGVRAAACGYNHSVFLKEDGSVWGMGDNSQSQLGSARASDPLRYQIASGAKAVAAGLFQTFIIKTDDTLWVTGRTYTNFTQVADSVAEVACGTDHVWLRKTDGSLWTSGSGANGQLGDGTYLARSDFVRVAEAVEGIAAGGENGFFLRSGGKLFAAGGNFHGEFGLGEAPGTALPLLVGTGIQQAALGDSHALFLKADGTLWSAGSNRSGQLGNGNKDFQSSPTFVSDDVVSASAGPFQTLYIRGDGSLWGVGRNVDRELSASLYPSLREPVKIADDVATAAAVDSGSFFIGRDRALWARGKNTWGRFGTGTVDSASTPVRVASDVRQIAASESHALFVKHDNTAWGMGSNHYAQLGVSDPVTSSVPVLIAGDVRTVYTDGNQDFSAGSGRGAYIKLDGALWTFGGSGAGGMGYPAPLGEDHPPGKVDDEVIQADIQATNRLVYLKFDGTLWASGVLETGWLPSTSISTYPVKIATGVKRFANGGRYLLKDDNSVWVWTPRYTEVSGVVVPAAYRQLLRGSVVDLSANISHAAFLVVPPPVVTQTPVSQVARAGERVELSVIATGVGTLSYQWRRDGVPLSGASARTSRLVIDSAQSADSGAYDVVVSLVGQETLAGTAHVTVHTEQQTSFAEWAAAHGVTDDPTADPDGGAGMPALLRYAFKLPAAGSVNAPLEVDAVEAEGERRLAVTFARKGHAPGLSYVVESSSDLVTWMQIEIIHPGVPELVTVADDVALGADARSRFLRVRVDLAE